MVDTNFPCGNKSDGRNLILNSGIEHSNNLYEIARYTTSDFIDFDSVYTVTIWGKLGDGKRGFAVFVGNSSNILASRNLKEISPSVYSITGKIAKSDKYPVDDKDKNKILVFASENGIDVVSTINKIKFERGSVATPWTPAPEDVVVKSELEALIKRVAVLEEKAGITSADSSAELPSVDMMEPVDDMETSSIEMEAE